MGIELSEIDDGRLHVATISPDNKVLTISKNYDLQFIEPCNGYVSGYICINGRGSQRAVENEDCIEFGVMLKKALQNSELKIEIV